MNNKKKNKGSWKQLIPIALFMILGGVCGFLMTTHEASLSTESNSNSFFKYIILIVFLYVGIFCQIAVHEAGHLVFGLLSGYKFTSYRIGSFMWVKENGKLRFKRFSLAGTSGQCLMEPPEMTDGCFPVVLYNLGGSLMNIISSVVCFGIYLLLKNIPVISTAFLMMFVTGVFFAAMNGIPMRLGTIDNDGYNAISIRKNSVSMRSFWLQMKMNAELSKGVRSKDMPDEWFAIPSDEEMKNSMTAALGGFCCGRLMDAHNFIEAEKLMKHFLEIESGIIGIHRNLLICDLLCCEIIGENRKEQVETLYTKELQKFMKSMKNYPSVLRTQYIYALLYEKDGKKADGIKKRMEIGFRNYPYQGEILAEFEFMEIANRKAEKVQQ